jgi:hypothetical protein
MNATKRKSNAICLVTYFITFVLLYVLHVFLFSIISVIEVWFVLCKTCLMSKKQHKYISKGKLFLCYSNMLA